MKIRVYIVFLLGVAWNITAMQQEVVVNLAESDSDSAPQRSTVLKRTGDFLESETAKKPRMDATEQAHEAPGIPEIRDLQMFEMQSAGEKPVEDAMVLEEVVAAAPGPEKGNLDPQLLRTEALKKELFRAAINGDQARLESVLGQGAIHAWCDLNDNTILHCAAGRGHLAVVKWLVQQHPDLMNKVNHLGSTVLHFGAYYGQLPVVQWLVQQYPYRVKMTNKSGLTALRIARVRQHTAIVSLLEQAERDLASQLHVGQIRRSLPREQNQQPVRQAPMMSQGLIQPLQIRDVIDFIDVHAVVRSRTALHQFLLSGNDVVIALLEKGANVDAQDGEGNTALILAVKAKDKELIELLLLLGGGAKVDIQNNAGETALIVATKNGLLEIMTLLMERGAHIETKDAAGKTFIAYLQPELRGFIGALIAKRHD